MAVFSGPEIVNDGLVFHYDMGNTEKSWKGKPTTNLQLPNIIDWSNDAIVTLLSEKSPIGTPVYSVVDNTSSYMSCTRNITVPNDSNTYTISIYIKKTYGATSARLGFNSGFTGGTPIYGNQRFNSDTGVGNIGLTEDLGYWWRWKYQVTNNSTGNTTLYCSFYPATGFYNSGDNSTATGEAIVSAIQIEANSFATPFVNGTRSNTEAVRDLTGNNTITANSLTYNSNGTFEFDGTSHSVTIPSLISNTDYSVNAWIKLNTLGRTNPIIGDLQYSWWRFFISSNNQIRAGHKESDQLGGPDVITSATVDLNWHNVAVTFSTNSGLYIYLDGQQVGYQNNRRPFLLVGRGPQYIGQHREGAPSGPNYLHGMLPILNIYTRALSASEIQQNFEAHRTRFGI